MRASMVLLAATAFSFTLAQVPSVPAAPAAPAPPSAPSSSSSAARPSHTPAHRQSRRTKKNKPQRSYQHGKSSHRRKHKGKRDDMLTMDDILPEDLLQRDIDYAHYKEHDHEVAPLKALFDKLNTRELVNEDSMPLFDTSSDDANDSQTQDDSLFRRKLGQQHKAKLDKDVKLANVDVVASILRRDGDALDILSADQDSSNDGELLRRAHKMKDLLKDSNLINADIVADILRRDSPMDEALPLTFEDDGTDSTEQEPEYTSDDSSLLRRRALLDHPVVQVTADLDLDGLSSDHSGKKSSAVKLLNLRRALLENMDACKELIGSATCDGLGLAEAASKRV